MKKTIILALISFYALAAFAQKVNYSYYFNDPAKTSKNVVYLDFASFDGSLNAGLHGMAKPVGNLTINGLFRYGYLGLTKGAEKNKLNDESIKASYMAEANVFLPLANYERKKEKRTPIHVESGYGSSKSLTVPSKVGRMLGVRGGVYAYRTGLVGNDDNPFKSNGNEIKPGTDKTLVANQGSTGLYVGYSGIKTRKVGVDISGYGKRRAFLRRTFFAEAMFGTTHIDKLTVSGQTVDITDTDHSAIGYRVGWEWEENGVSTRVEIGKRPGYSNITLLPTNYVLLNFGFRIYGKEKFLDK